MKPSEVERVWELAPLPPSEADFLGKIEMPCGISGCGQGPSYVAWERWRSVEGRKAKVLRLCREHALAFAKEHQLRVEDREEASF